MEESSDTAAVERAMAAIRNRQRRRTILRSAEHAGAMALDPALYEVIDAVEAAAGDGRPLTVSSLAVRLGVDQPHASRLAARAVEHGLAYREADQLDGRRSLLRLTPTGTRHVAAMRAWRRDHFARAMTDWSPRDRADFARLLTRFVADLARIEPE